MYSLNKHKFWVSKACHVLGIPDNHTERSLNLYSPPEEKKYLGVTGMLFHCFNRY